MGALGTKIRSQNIDVALSQLKLPGFAIQSISPLDPSGWIRVNLIRTATAPAPAMTASAPMVVQPATVYCHLAGGQPGSGRRHSDCRHDGPGGDQSVGCPPASSLSPAA